MVSSQQWKKFIFSNKFIKQFIKFYVDFNLLWSVLLIFFLKVCIIFWVKVLHLISELE